MFFADFRRRRRIGKWLQKWLGPMPQDRRREAVERLLEADARTVFHIQECRRRGLRNLELKIQWLEDEAFRRLRASAGPHLLAFSHLGPPMAVGPSLAKIGYFTALIHGSTAVEDAVEADRSVETTSVEYVALAKRCDANALPLIEALSRLRRGGSVGFAVDAFDPVAGLKMRYLGLEIPVGRGVAYLARRSGATVVPILCTWKSRERIVAQVGDVIAPPSAAEASVWEIELTRRVLGWFEIQAAQSPEQVRLRHFERFIRAA